ncbi:hypothetical protein PGT21_021733 [Puccinia graminis f. sp. tritici]|uniref:Uncharacterized protein n=2 Tax=Puccinia graminis f. sp. tritici TaxID=56615 RepID=E3L4F9_PUCGT|nr:uncharacterized protein PGTG_17390 [Puccinia graminis f. sp. tritici CRL 75-36-700-3]EFP91434.1 hypothetical protein PGTG_17390 [Puccinia graminis f. sp. tritici CRL 75-36-700-3]KAA1108690.1 hypothetical protein PGT21_021733 [Puccinia graminis f. sp. tritici]KAA1138404.1 hypothetical protein PGTUg99_001996 [Puccinia graminis f. sp. tritici]
MYSFKFFVAYVVVFFQIQVGADDPAPLYQPVPEPAGSKPTKLPKVRIDVIAPSGWVCPVDIPSSWCVRTLPLVGDQTRYGIYPAKKLQQLEAPDNRIVWDCTGYIYDGKNEIAQMGVCCGKSYKPGKPVKKGSYSIQTYPEYLANKCQDIKKFKREASPGGV